MRKVVRCAKCSSAAIKQGFGFTGESYMYCAKLDSLIYPDDGCTFGSHGEPRTAVEDISVNIDSRATVNGWH